MSGPYDRPMNIVPPGQLDPSYGIYDTQYQSFPGMAGPPTPFDGIGFWYRPDAQDSVYHREESLFGHGLTLHTAQTEQQAGIKHRRTRSGCFTCRSRRVKCDERRPICDRCRKGNRECEFPPTTSSTKRGKLTESKTETSELTAQSARQEGRLDTIKDESEEEEEDEDAEGDEVPSSAKSSTRPVLGTARSQSIQSISRKSRSRQHSEASLLASEISNSPTGDELPLTSPISTVSSARTFAPIAEAIERSRGLKPEQKKEVTKYLKFQQEHMTFYHYFFKIDPEDFLHGEFIELALRFEPLLLAVVGFAAYHYTLQLPDEEADFNSFWKYYCKSIVKLRQWLEKHQERDDLVMLTVLQLATFEEYMGDWTNLAAHQRAAHSILTTNFTPESIMNADRSRRIFDWYSRLDVISGLMAVRDATLDRVWLAHSTSWHEERAKSANAEVGDVLIYFTACIRLVGFDMAHLFAHINQAQAQFEQGKDPGDSMSDLLNQVHAIHNRLDVVRKEIQQVHNTKFTSTDAEPLPADEEEAFNPRIPLFRGALWPLNFIWTDWYGIVQMLKYHTFLAECKAESMERAREGKVGGPPSIEPPADLSRLSQILCQIYEAIERSPNAPSGAILGCQASLGLSAVFLPKPPPQENHKFMMWARRKLANFERQGYVWPPQFRRRMAEHWDIAELNDWWLPNGEGKLKILDEIRTVVEDRNKATAELLERTGKDDGRSDLREIRGIFENLSLSHRSDTNRSMTLSEALDTNFMASMVSSPSDAESSTGSLIETNPRDASEQFGRQDQSTRRRSRACSLTGTSSGSTRPAGTPASGPPPSQPTDRMSGIWEKPPS